MRNFTLFLALILVTLFTNGQKTETLQKRMETAKEKYTRLLSLRQSGVNHAKSPTNWNLSFEKTLKSAAATMKLDSTITKIWSDETQALEYDSKEEFVYDDEMRNTMWLHSDWIDISEDWHLWSKTEVDYNPDGTVGTMNIYESFEPGTEPLLINKLYSFYNEAGQLDSVQHWYTEDQQTWNLEGKQIYHYNASGQLTEMQMWSLEEDEGEEYMSVMRFVFTYTNSGRMETSSMFFLFDEEEMLFFKTFYYYDGSNRLTHTEDWTLNLMSFELEKDCRSDFEYNASGDLATDIYSEWDPADETWVENYTDEYTYYDFSNSEVLYPSHMLFYGIVEETPMFGKAVKEIETMEWIEGTQMLTEKTSFYYSAATNTFANQISEAKFSVYPNPSSDNVTFKWNEKQVNLSLEIYQVAGSKILEKHISSGIPVSLNGIDSGIYFFKLNNEKQTIYSGKLIKK
ncbi:MAG: T9SS type A sorting domain-containing protein [Mariniphaga sp.]|jgi:hypothetical protein|nr:T9SS type A sorting domain-containing protein [Mariniphaga sp.]